jgi:hypothetical protein
MCFPFNMKRKVTLTYWQTDVMKFAIACIFLAMGIRFGYDLQPYFWPILLFGIALSIWAIVIWFRAKKEK